ncbi:MAG: hypothetical protein R2748_24190 [Bryobacterales bacterium]
MLFVAAGTPVVDVIPLLTPELGSSPCGGTIHVRNMSKPPRTWPTPLNVRLGAQEEGGEEVNPEATVRSRLVLARRRRSGTDRLDFRRRPGPEPERNRRD